MASGVDNKQTDTRLGAIQLVLGERKALKCGFMNILRSDRALEV